MRDRIKALLHRQQADYIEIHLEENLLTDLEYEDRTLADVRHTTNRGGNVRVLTKGGWGFVSFNDWSQLETYTALAVEQARSVGQGKSVLASVEPVVASVAWQWLTSPLSVPLAEKKQLFDTYHEAMLSASPKIRNSFISYSDSLRRLTFANSEGTYLEQEQGDISATLAAIASDGEEMQTAQLSLGSPNDYRVIENRHQDVAELARQAEALLEAGSLKGGQYRVILDPEMAGTFIHETIGHLSEADFLYQDERARALMALGQRLGPTSLNVVDEAARPNLRGSYKYDDEGTPASKTYLIREGVLVGRLHSRHTAGLMGEPPTGNARAVNYRFPPIVRMTNTYIEPGRVSFDDMLAGIKKGVYVKGSYGGETSADTFTFASPLAIVIRNGRLEEVVRGIYLSGQIFETLDHIEAIGNDLLYDQGGSCTKDQQSALPVSSGSPHLLISNLAVAGS